MPTVNPIGGTYDFIIDGVNVTGIPHDRYVGGDMMYAIDTLILTGEKPKGSSITYAELEARCVKPNAERIEDDNFLGDDSDMTFVLPERQQDDLEECESCQ